MADGPGARIVDRVGVLVLPDTSKFKPALKKYLERVSRTEKVEVGVDLDASGLQRQTKQATSAASKGAKVEASGGLEDGFISQMQRDVRAAMRTIDAEVPLTADGERLRREARAKVAELQARMASMALEVPLDPEAGAAARADLKGEVAELQAMARLNPIEVPLDIDVKDAGKALAGGAASLGSGGVGMLNPAMIGAALALAVGAATVIGGLLAALPGIIASIAAPIGVMALGWEGISRAASELKEPISYLQSLVSDTFATQLTPVFRELADVLPSLGPALQGLATAVSGGLGEVISALSKPESMAKMSEIITNIADAINILSPVLGPLVDVFMDFALVATQAFVDNAPALLSALEQLTKLFQWLVDSGVLRTAVDAFSQMVIFGTILASVFIAVSIGLAAVWQWGTQLVGTLLQLVGAFMGLQVAAGVALGGLLLQWAGLGVQVLTALAGFPMQILGFFGGVFSQLNQMTGGRLGAFVALFLTLPVRIVGALAALPGQVLGFFGGMFGRLNQMTGGRLGALVGIFLTLPMRVVGAITALPGLVIGLFRNLFTRVTGSTSGGIGRVVGIFLTLPGRALGAIAALPGLIMGLITGLFTRMVGSTSGGVGRVVGILVTLPGRALGAISSLPGLLMSLAVSAFTSMAGAVSGGVGNVVSIVGGLAGDVVGAVSGLPGDLYSIGAQMISSLASGMTSQLASVASAAGGIASSIKDKFPGSPVKEGPLKAWNYGYGTTGAGRRLIGDLAAGMRAERDGVAAAARNIAGAVVDPVDRATASQSAAAFSNMQVITRIGDRDFVGVIQRAQTRQRGR